MSRLFLLRLIGLGEVESLGSSEQDDDEAEMADMFFCFRFTSGTSGSGTVAFPVVGFFESV